MVALSSCSEPTLPDIGEVGEIEDGMLQQVLEIIVDRRNVPALGGFVVRIPADDEPIMESAVAGDRSEGSPVDVELDDLWHLGSLTKSMTATLAARLVEQGIISWDITIADVFPELVGTIRDAYEDVQLDELLHHTSGLPSDVTQTPSWPDLRSSTLPLVEQRRNWIEELLALAPEPKGEHLYSNAGYVVAGAMLEEVTGTAWEDLMRDEIFTPLGMSSAGFGPPGTPGGLDQPLGHQLVGNQWQPVPPGPEADNPQALGPAGTVHASLQDLMAYAVVHLNGLRGSSDFLLESATWQKLHTAAQGTGYALGWGVDQRTWANGTVLAHSGSNTLWFAVLWIAPERDMVLGAVTNAWGKSDADVPESARTDAEQAADQAVQAMILRAGFSL